MTTPKERARALVELRDCAVDVVNNAEETSEGFLVPKDKLKKLVRAWRHYPWNSEISEIIENAPSFLLSFPDKEK